MRRDGGMLAFLLIALALSLMAYWHVTRPMPGTVDWLEAKVAEEREAGTPIGTTETATPLTVSQGDQPTFGTSGNNNLVMSSLWTSKTYITIGPYNYAGTVPYQPPTWLEFHEPLPDSFEIRVQGGRVWTLGELRRAK